MTNKLKCLAKPFEERLILFNLKDKYQNSQIVII